jgi:hypothetical protein
MVVTTVATARRFALAAASFGVLIAAIGTAEAAGALAVGTCGAYGYGFDYSRVEDARRGDEQVRGRQLQGRGHRPQGLRRDGDRCQKSVRLVRLGARFSSRAGREQVDAALLRIRRPRLRAARLGLRREGLEHDPEKWKPVFR